MMLILIFSISLVESKPEKKPIVKERGIEVKSTWPSFSDNPDAPKKTCKELGLRICEVKQVIVKTSRTLVHSDKETGLVA